MKLVSALLLSSIALASIALAAELPSGESILGQSLERSGGAANFEKIKNVVMTGNVEMVGHNISGPISMYQSGDKSYSVIDLPGIGKVEEGYDGKVAWEMSALQGARIKDGEEQAAVKRASRLDLVRTWRDYYKSARTLGSEDVDGKPAWKLEMLPLEGKPETFYFDKDSGLLVRVAMTMPTALGEIPVDVSLSDYRAVDGVKTPFTMTQHAMSQTLRMHFDQVTYNAPMPANRFDLPSTVKAIRDKQTK